MDAQVPPLPALRIAIVPGVTPGKWVRRWEERVPDVPLTVSACEEAEQAAVLWDGRADLSFVRLPVDREGLSVIPLYTEVPVVVAPKDHDIELYDDDVPLAELDGQNFLDPMEMGGAKTGVEVVASGAGLMILPMSVARLHNRKDVVYKPLSGWHGLPNRPTKPSRNSSGLSAAARPTVPGSPRPSRRPDRRTPKRGASPPAEAAARPGR
jgi:DNA-binding transcriptional LysR family regulator